ncbi:MAG TPA: hypothetical protein VLM89_03325 [Phycisphaerae bacterium]|nr:hypothetical protein [Phycisphaerae bacterium]
MPDPAALSEESQAGLGPVIRVEENWYLMLNEANGALNAPQYHTVMSPTGDLDGVYAQIVWNYREAPEYRAGGLQVQLWDDGELACYKSDREVPLSRSVEIIRWKQVLETNGQVVSFSIPFGQSGTWGSFGQGLTLSLAGGPADLSGYSPDVSVGNASVTFGSNRVNILGISSVSYYGPNGLIAVDDTPRVAYRLSGN